MSPHIARFGDERDWFCARRLGLFLHWGLYAVPGWHEQHQFRRGLTRAEYAPLLGQFNPTRFDPDAWLDVAEAAGCEYLTFTAKHIDGFCLWDTRQTDYNVTRSAYGRDVLALLAAACERRGFPLCLYYSCADMHHLCYPNAGRSYELPGPEPGDTPDLERYLEFVRAQVRELCTQYGRLHGFWWDANMTGTRDPSINALIRELQPAAVINNRGYDDGDFGTPERDWDRSVQTQPWFTTPVEACQSVGYQSWGWRADEDYYTEAHLLRSLHRVLAKGGNYLLNLGPQPDGCLPAEGTALLARLGEWWRRLRPTVVDTEPVGVLPGLVLTRREQRLYVHVVAEPETHSLYLHPLTTAPRRATLLNTGEPVAWDVVDLPSLHAQQPQRCLRLKHLPNRERLTAGWVLELEFDRLPETRWA